MGPGSNLEEEFPRLYRLERDVGVSIAGRGMWQDNTWVWRREPRGRERGELVELSTKLQGSMPVRGRRDTWEWAWDVARGYSVKKCREMIRNGGPRNSSNLVETLWSLITPRKINIFLWRARLGRIPTRSALNNKGIDLGTILCPRCKDAIEDVEHALVNCNEVKRTWRRFGAWWKKIDDMGSLVQLLQEDAVTLKNSKGASWRIGAKWSLLYMIWIQRNKLVFRGDNTRLDDLFFIWQRTIYEWVSRR